ncbi:class I SAM-dependent methyltransferase [Paenibacillus ginsengarvi]|uniref:Class I SAM-dependent methyltransferase n=1 Tax=Paenibacillus ginsengarvi TaxID=400777 RepID=A0A3B0C4C1_9BACL|nr:class I SAM-dependent methyltransferase [Paenibacillus ginsengarvi]RKN79059.1 class I SAM-dependent methyltransferase [Paenibacillus ginsengarvi]
MNKYGDLLFKDTAGYYSLYRPVYPAALVRFLVSRFRLDGSGRLLDIGCGTGRLTLRFADWFEELHGLDAEPEMIAEAERLTLETRISNANWTTGFAPHFPNGWRSDYFRLVLMALSFHWMDRDQTLETLYPLVCEGGGIAIIDNYDPDRKMLPWEETVQCVIRKWLGEQRRAGNSTYSHPEHSHGTIVERSRFRVERHRLPPYTVQWDMRSLIGYLYSTSYASPRLFGGRTKEFEADLTEALLTIEPSGIFAKSTSLSVILALKN